jgi:hypothetical protein
MFTSQEIGFVIPFMIILLAVLYILPDTLVVFKDLFETLKRLFRKGGTMIHKLVQNIQHKTLNINYLFYFFKIVISSFWEAESMDMKR